MVDASHLLRRRVLIVEDDEGICTQLAELLASEGFEVEVAGDGDQALEVLSTNAHFDAIVLDLMLPNKDGWEFRVEQRADPIFSAIPVVVMSANTSARARAIHADAYVPKPFDPEEMVAIVRRVIDQRRLAEQDRLASLGRMAAGIAHEVNNPLTYVHASLMLGQNILNATSAQLDPALGAPLSSAGAAVEKAIHGVERMRTIMGGLRMFIRASDDHRALVDVRAVIESSLSLAAHEIAQKAKIEKHLADVPLVWGNPGQLGQLVINLITNAADSIEPGDPAKHRIAVHVSTSPEGDVVIEVVDNGSGMSETIREKIFEPFFTTKPPGVGTGLGLSICHGIVQGHQGTISASSTPGQGTSIRVVLPHAAAAASKDPSPKRLLIIEDNENVADALAAILGDDYDATLVVGDGDRAMSVLEKDSAPFETILCDMHLGCVTGKQIYERLRSNRPELARRVIFMTGAALSAPLRRFLDEGPAPCLIKPFNRSEFRKAVEALPIATRKASGTQMRAIAPEVEKSRMGSKPPRGG